VRNPRFWANTIGTLAIGGVVLVTIAGAGHAEGPATVSAPKAATRPLARTLVADEPLIDPGSEQGERARGLYFSAPVQKRLGARGVIGKLRKLGLDAAVLDMKDGEGRVSYDTQIPALQPQKRRYVDDVPAFIAELKRAGIYTIARVVCFSDPFLPRNEPDRAVMDNRPNKAGKIWASWGKRNTWLDPYNPKNHDLVVEMAKEVEALGFDEIQFDYIRFPVDSAVRFAQFPAQVGTPRRFVLLGMLKRIDEAVRIPLGADVFGLAALNEGDPAGLGQSLADWTPHLEVFSPMLYLNGMQSLVPKGGPQRAMRLIYSGVSRLRQRIGAEPVIRPFLQAFEAGADYYNPEFIAEQIRGAKSAGADGFLFWHPGSHFKMVEAGLAGPARGLSPFTFDARLAARERAWGVQRDREAGEADAAPRPRLRMFPRAAAAADREQAEAEAETSPAGANRAPARAADANTPPRRPRPGERVVYRERRTPRVEAEATDRASGEPARPPQQQ